MAGRARVWHPPGTKLRIGKDRKEGCKAPGLAGCAWLCGHAGGGVPGLRLGGWEPRDFPAAGQLLGRLTRRESHTQEATRAPSFETPCALRFSDKLDHLQINKACNRAESPHSQGTERPYSPRNSSFKLGYTSMEKMKSLSFFWNMSFLDKPDSVCLQI